MNAPATLPPSALIPITTGQVDGQEANTVNARALHSFLEVGKDFSTWIKDRIEQFGFTENQDFIVFPEIGEKGGRPQITYHLTLDMAKELSMVERNEKGKQARQYFIECERQSKAPFQIPENLGDALLLAGTLAKEKEAALLQIEADRPKVELASAIEASTKAIKIEEFAKSISKPPRPIIGRNIMYQILRNLKMVSDFNNLPLQRYIDCGWFEVKQGTYENKGTNGPRSCLTTMITGKGQVAVYKRVMEYLETVGEPA